MKYSSFFFGLLIATLIIPLPALARIPNDPHVRQWAYEDIGAYAAWDSARGSRSVVVAVIDNGFDTFHPDLARNVWKNTDEIPRNNKDDDNNGYIDDVWGWDFSIEDRDGDGEIEKIETRGDNDPRPSVLGMTEGRRRAGIFHHGTLVAGLIGAIGNNGKGTAGINWNVQLMNVRVLGNGGSGDLTNLDKAIRYAVDNGADIINFSIVGDRNTPAIAAAIEYAYEHDVILIAAAGNERSFLNATPRYPVCSDAGRDVQQVLGVSAIGEEHYIAPFSNFGSDCVDLTAPGVNILSTLRYAPRFELNNLVGGGWNGTSFAAPFVSGTAALLKALHPTWGPAEVFDTILSTLHVTPDEIDETYANLFGNGLLQVDDAISLARETLPKAVRQAIASFVTIDASTQTGYTWNGARNPGALPILAKNTTDIRSVFDERGSTAYIASVFDPVAQQVTVTQYDAQWRSIHSFVRRAIGPMNVLAVDITGSAAPEIVLAPAHENDELFMIYTQDGRLIDTKSIDGLHNGVSLAPGMIQGTFVAAYAVEKEPGVTVSTYDIASDALTSFTSRSISTVSGVGVGDIDNDAEAEYILSAGPGEPAWLLYLETDGSLKRKFTAYDVPRNPGIEIIVGDYNDDGEDDIVTALRSGDQPMRIWTQRSKKLAQWKDSLAQGTRILFSGTLP